MRRVIYLHIRTVFWIGKRIASVNYWIYMRLMMLCKMKYIQLNRSCISLVRLSLRLLLQSWQGVIQIRRWNYDLRSISLLILFGIRKDYCTGARNVFLYLFVSRPIKLICCRRRLSLVLPSCNILSNIFLLSLTPYVDRFIGEAQSGLFRRNRSTVSKIFNMHQVLENKLEYNRTIHL
jgi:hypothetical protein